MFERQSHQGVTARVQEVEATQEGVEDNCGDVTEKVMEQEKCEMEPHGGEDQRGTEDTDEEGSWKSKRSSSSIEELDQCCSRVK